MIRPLLTKNNNLYTKKRFSQYSFYIGIFLLFVLLPIKNGLVAQINISTPESQIKDFLQKAAAFQEQRVADSSKYYGSLTNPVI